MRRYVLDTNICLAYVRGHQLYSDIESELELSKPDAVVIISVVTKAELFSLGVQNNWGAKKLEILNGLLHKLIIVDIDDNDHGLIDPYVNIDAFSQGKLKSKTLGMTARNMGKNDLWIASTAHVAKAKLITTDGDFDHLNQNYLDVIKYQVV